MANKRLAQERLSVRVRDAMTAGVVTVAPDNPALTAAELLARLDLSGLPVVDAEQQVLGVITEYDVIQAARLGGDLRKRTVADVMQDRPVFVEPDTPLDEAIDFMEQWRVRRLPVCRDGRLVGVISRGDVLRVLLGGLPNSSEASSRGRRVRS